MNGAVSYLLTDHMMEETEDFLMEEVLRVFLMGEERREVCCFFR